MGLFDTYYGAQSGLFGPLLPADEFNVLAPQPSGFMFPGVVPGGFGAGTGLTLGGASVAPLNGDQSGSTPYTPPSDPYHLTGIIPQFTSVFDTGSYTPQSNEPLFGTQNKNWGIRDGSILSQLIDGLTSRPATAPLAAPTSSPATAGAAFQADQSLPQYNTASVPLPPSRPDIPIQLPPSKPSVPTVPPQMATQELSAQQRPQESQPVYEPSRGGLRDAISGAMANAYNGPLGLLFGGIAGAAGMGTGNPQQNIARTVYQSLAPRYGHERAMALAQMASQNPEFAKAIVPEALGIYPAPKTMEEFAAQEAARARSGAGGGGGGGGAAIGGAPTGLGGYAQFKTIQHEAEQTGKDLAARQKQIDADTTSAVNMRNVLDRMAKLTPIAYEGAGAPGLQYLRSYMQTFLNTDVSKIKAGEEFTSLVSKAGLEAMGGHLGTGFSDADREYVKDQFPRLSQTKEGRMEIINNMRALADRKIQVGQLAQQYFAQNGSLRGFDNALAKWSEQNPIFAASGNRVPQGAINGGQYDWSPGGGLRRRGG